MLQNSAQIPHRTLQNSAQFQGRPIVQATVMWQANDEKIEKKKKKNEKKREKKKYNMKHTKSTSFLMQKICSGPTLIQDCPFHSQDCITRIMAKNVHVAIKVTKS